MHCISITVVLLYLVHGTVPLHIQKTSFYSVSTSNHSQIPLDPHWWEMLAYSCHCKFLLVALFDGCGVVCWKKLHISWVLRHALFAMIAWLWSQMWSWLQSINWCICLVGQLINWLSCIWPISALRWGSCCALCIICWTLLHNHDQSWSVVVHCWV